MRIDDVFSRALRSGELVFAENLRLPDPSRRMPIRRYRKKA
jgi:hypothetical protein